MDNSMKMRQRAILAVGGYAMSCAPAFLSGKTMNANRVSLVPTVLSFHGKSVPIVIGGPPTH